MKPADSKLFYSVAWALGVVEELRAKYPRATMLAYELLEISPRQLALFLARADPVYAQIRTMIHWINNWLQRGGFVRFYSTDVKCFRVLLKRNGFERLVNRMIELDKDCKCDSIEEQVSKGVLPNPSEELPVPCEGEGNPPSTPMFPEVSRE